MNNGLWFCGLYVVTGFLKVYWSKYGGAQKPPVPMKNGFLALGAIVLPIGRFADPAFKDDPNTPAAICRTGIDSNLDHAQTVAFFGAILWIYLSDQRLVMGAFALVVVFIARASGFWSTFRRIEKAQEGLVEKSTLAPS